MTCLYNVSNKFIFATIVNFIFYSLIKCYSLQTAISFTGYRKQSGRAKGVGRGGVLRELVSGGEAGKVVGLAAWFVWAAELETLGVDFVDEVDGGFAMLPIKL